MKYKLFFVASLLFFNFSVIIYMGEYLLNKRKQLDNLEKKVNLLNSEIEERDYQLSRYQYVFDVVDSLNLVNKAKIDSIFNTIQ